MGNLQPLPQPVFNLVAVLLHMAVQLASRLCRNCLQNGSLVFAFAEKNFVKDFFFLDRPVFASAGDQLG